MTTIKESSTNQLNRKAIATQCPVTFTLFKMGGRWKPLIIYNLVNHSKRYGELKRAVTGISEKMLFQTLKELETDGLIVRTVLPTVPAQVEYSLSPCGTDLYPVFLAMVDWAKKYNVAQ